MSTEWDRQTAVTDLGEGVYGADLADGWRVGGGVNGGYLLATIGHALSEVTEKRDPLSVRRSSRCLKRRSGAPEGRSLGNRAETAPELDRVFRAGTE